LNGLYFSRLTVPRDEAGAANVALMVRRYGAVHLVWVDRDDSAFHRQEARENEEFVRRLNLRCPARLLYENRYPSGELLNIWEITGCP
jgi:hypothetical protein